MAEFYTSPANKPSFQAAGYQEALAWVDGHEHVFGWQMENFDLVYEALTKDTDVSLECVLTDAGLNQQVVDIAFEETGCHDDIRLYEQAALFVEGLLVPREAARRPRLIRWGQFCACRAAQEDYRGYRGHQVMKNNA